MPLERSERLGYGVIVGVTHEMVVTLYAARGTAGRANGFSVRPAQTCSLRQGFRQLTAVLCQLLHHALVQPGVHGGGVIHVT